MIPVLCRRDLLASGATAALLATLPGQQARAAGTTDLSVVRRTLDVNGKPAAVFGIVRGDGAPGVSLELGERFAVDLRNRCGEPTIIHWHGQAPPVRQDGVTQTGLEALIANGADQGYDYAPRPGTHWMHSHHGLQEQVLMAAPLVVRTAEDARTDAQEVIVMLHDFAFRDPREILAELTGTKPGGTAAAGMSMGGGGAMPAGGMAGGGMSGQGIAGMAMPMATPPKPGATKSGGAMDLNDIDFDAYLANDRTLADPLVVRAERGGRVRLRLINGATSTAFWISLGGLAGQVVAVDGDPVYPMPVRRFPIAEAQRVDVLLRLPPGGGAFPILAQREGDRQRTGIILATPGAAVARVGEEAATPAGAAADWSLERQLRALTPLPPRKPDRVHRVALTGSMMPYAWGIDGRSWPDHTPLTVTRGERVALDLVNRTTMAHPMHLHGHHFQVLALNGTAFAGAMRDTVLVPPRATVRIGFDADNIGRWLFHCHNLYHMATGMMTEVAYTGFSAGY
ncbi:MAG: multicopper oxidase domain-containing protein [Rhodospirillales bacterium]|nr:multicopper oxidase domain-containing protein [Rhodospirillales bacterium]